MDSSIYCKGEKRMEGKVKWFQQNKGYGFIVDEKQREIFVHYSHILKTGYRTLNDDERVVFDVVEDAKGLQARNVKSLENV